ncbi:DUF6232 family protein [Streptomyces sp. BE133]|uniref:DUF6232 family protein n=1 Tax=Streptomyces sp. BE133 TaxID=3002523 RepID=UPI002E795832|nr:DUF6232 family protein [Streptomyces sp. BE133]MEE1809726.1 DUF6232 family protein [Streptomyces sp. BE133]
MGASEAPPPKPTHAPSPRVAPGVPPRDGLVISKRLLWVHGAAYPLENIVRVYTFELTPRRGEAFTRFLRRGGFTLLLLFLLMWLSDSSKGSYGYGSSSDLEGAFQFFLVVVVGMLIYFFAEMAGVVFAASHPVLAVETNGRSTALVTGKREYLNGLVYSIAEAIDRPDAEFHASVTSLAITNYGNYHFGDSVNIYGGIGHTGVSK